MSVAYDFVLAYSICCSVRARPSLVHINDFQRTGLLRWIAHHRLIIKDDTFAGPERGGCAREVAEHEERLPPHFLCLERDDVSDAAVGGEEGEELVLELILVDLVVEVLQVERRVGL